MTDTIVFDELLSAGPAVVHDSLGELRAALPNLPIAPVRISR